MELLKEIVDIFILSKKESDTWDFKLCHHRNSLQLVKDIICLANVISEEDRYLILGVSDQFEIKGLANDENRRTQADIINILRDAKFAEDRYPDIFLQTIDEYDIDVIIIKNRPEKPYYLKEIMSKEGKNLYPGTVYSRVRDTNTPTNRSAESRLIEEMWKERFGLNIHPVDRICSLLKDDSVWIHDIGNKKYAYNEQYPEFRFELKGVNEFQDEISYFFINESSFKGNVKFLYNSTILFEMTYVYLDEMRQILPFPDITVAARKPFYYLLRDSKKGAFFKFLVRNNYNSFERDGEIEPIVILEDNADLNRFKRIIEENMEKIEEYELSYSAEKAVASTGRDNGKYMSAIWKLKNEIYT